MSSTAPPPEGGTARADETAEGNDPLGGETLQIERPSASRRVAPSASSSASSTSSKKKRLGGPALFAGVFVVGFVVAFGVGAIFLWGGSGIEGKLDRGDADGVLAALAQKPQLTAQEALWKGHALHMKGNSIDMLRAYQAAVVAGIVDATAEKHTLDALGADNTTALAVKTLEDWPGDAMNAQLVALCDDDEPRRRDAAFEALRARRKTPPTPKELLECRVHSAVKSLAADVCEVKQAGVASLVELVDIPDAVPFLRSTEAWKVAFDNRSDVVFARHRCLNQEQVKLVEQRLATLSK